MTSVYDPGSCPCGGTTRYYDGALGYEAHVCEKCNRHFPVGMADDSERVIVDIAVGYQKGHWETVRVDTNGVTPEMLTDEHELLRVLPPHIQRRRDIAFVHFLNAVEKESEA
ncbi:MAG: hypothetical protein NXI32_04920 [bacterium]|nr:hypothetical protein [bacterium]